MGQHLLRMRPDSCQGCMDGRRQWGVWEKPRLHTAFLVLVLDLLGGENRLHLRCTLQSALLCFLSVSADSSDEGDRLADRRLNARHTRVRKE